MKRFQQEPNIREDPKILFFFEILWHRIHRTNNYKMKPLTI